MNKILEWIESRKLIAALILIGGVGGGLSSVFNVGRIVTEFFEADKTITGTICPILYDAKCADANEMVREALSHNVEEVIAIDLRIEYGGMDKRVSTCPNNDTDWGSTDEYYSIESGWSIFELPSDEKACQQDDFIGFSNDVLTAAEVPGGNQGTIFLIKGEFAVGLGELTTDELPAIANKGWYKLKKIN